MIFIGSDENKDATDGNFAPEGQGKETWRGFRDVGTRSPSSKGSKI